MMYFTDAVENPIQLNQEFEAQYDTAEYESKIARLLKHAYKRAKSESPGTLRMWKESIRELREGDHYLLVLWAYESKDVKERRRFDQLKLFGAGLAVASAALLIGSNSDRISSYLPEFFRGPIGWRVLVLWSRIFSDWFGVLFESKKNLSCG